MNILLLTYYAPPLNAITSQRAYSLAQLLKTHHQVHILTRHWTGKENEWEEMLLETDEHSVEQIDGVTIHYRPYRSSTKVASSLVQKSRTIRGWVRGHFNPEIDTLQFQDYALDLIKKENIQVIYATCPPLNIIKLGSELSKGQNLPFFADFRDLKNDIILNPEADISAKEVVEMRLLKRFLRETLARPNVYVSTVNDTFKAYFTKLGVKNCEVVLNGFDQSILHLNETPPKDLFRLSLLGTLYPNQHLEILLEGLKTFLTDHSNAPIEVLFIGTGAIKQVGEHIKNILPDARVKVTPKVNRDEALRIGSRSSVLFYAGWPGYKGVYSGKMFEYLGLRRRILLAPGDKDVLDQLLIQTNSGVSVFSSKECSDVLHDWFEIWKTKGELTCDSSNYMAYSREHQNSKIAQAINLLALD